MAVVPILWRYIVFGEPTLADAILDRTIHNAHRLKLSGDSLRKQQASKTIGAWTRCNQLWRDHCRPAGAPPPRPRSIGTPTSIGTAGRHQSECPADIVGIRKPAIGAAVGVNPHGRAQLVDVAVDSADRDLKLRRQRL